VITDVKFIVHIRVVFDRLRPGPYEGPSRLISVAA
jgi:hypothetical protein